MACILLQGDHGSVTVRGKLQGLANGAELERAVKTIVVNRGLGEDALLKDPDSPCKV